MWTLSIFLAIALWTVYTNQVETPAPFAQLPKQARKKKCKFTPICFSTAAARRRSEFYRSAIGAEIVMMMRFKDSPDPAMRATMTPGTEDKVMHTAMRIGETER